MRQIVGNGTEIEFEQYGAENPTSIVLMRGLGTQLIDWPRALLDGLVENGFRVVVFDNRDVGLSQKFTGQPDLGAVARGEETPPYQLDDMADDIAGLLDALEISRAYLFGISMGGMIGQVFAAKYGDRLSGFFSVMSTTSKPGLPPATDAATATLNGETDPNAGAEGVIQATADGLAVCGSPGYPLTEDERLAIARRRYDRDYTPGGVVRQMAAVIAGRDRQDMLARIKVPTLVIHGADDPLIPVEHGRDTAASIPNAKLEIIPGMGHDLPPALVPLMIGLISGFVQDTQVTE